MKLKTDILEESNRYQNLEDQLSVTREFECKSKKAFSVRRDERYKYGIIASKLDEIGRNEYTNEHITKDIKTREVYRDRLQNLITQSDSTGEDVASLRKKIGTVEHTLTALYWCII